MKKITFLSLLFFILTSSVIQAQQQTTYFEESIRIEEISKKITSPITITIDHNGLLVPSDKNLFDGLVKKVIENLNENNVKTSSSETDQNADGGPPAPGGSTQPTGTSTGKKTVNTTKEISDDIKKEIEKELLFILFISTTDSPNDLKKVISSFPKKFYHLATIAKVANFQTSSATTNFAFSESEIIYGIVDFTISRAKEQLVEVYLSNWYEELNANTLTSQMLPQTLGTLKAFNNDQSLNIAKYGDKWKAAFQEDLRNFPILLQKEKFTKTLLKNNPDIIEKSALISGGSRLLYNLYLKEHLVNVLNDMSNDYLIEADKNPATFKKMTVLADVLLKAGGIMSNNDSYKSVSLDQINRMEYKSWTTLIKLLFVRHYNALSYSSEKEIDKVLPILLTNQKIENFSQLYQQAINAVSTYQKAIDGGANISTSELDFEETRKIFEISFGLTKQFFKALSCISNSLKIDHINSFIEENEKYCQGLAEIGEGIANRRYGAVVDGTLSIISNLNKENTKKPNQTLIDLENNLQRYGSFMVNIINSKNEDDVKAALEELIPKNLYKLKNTHSFSFSLSSYPGIFAGTEKISKYQLNTDGTPATNLPKENSWAFSPAVYLPIGFDLNFGNRCSKDTSKFNSTNLFFQFLDLGAVLNYRITGSDSDEESDPNVTFKQIISPGIAVMRHFNNSPLVFGICANYTPSLRTVNQDGNQYKSNALRVGIFLAVDVTYFSLFTSKKESE